MPLHYKYYNLLVLIMKIYIYSKINKKQVYRSTLYGQNIYLVIPKQIIYRRKSVNGRRCFNNKLNQGHVDKVFIFFQSSFDD
jgi:hypothetical protein